MLTILFVAFLLIEVCGRFWLSNRQIRHVMQHRQAVPAEFSEKISLASHQRAADYTVARARLGIFERLFDAAVLVCLTLLGGLQEIDLWVSTLTTHDLLRQILLLVTLSVIISAIGLPFSLYRQFRLE